MSTVLPFRAVRPDPKVVKEVASYPYDVIDSQEARAIAKGNSISFLHVVKSEIDLAEDLDLHDPAVYAKGRENLAGFLTKEILFQDRTPCFYVYRQVMGAHVQYGIVACVSVDEYAAGTIKKHELTRADKEADRTRHIAELNAQTGPVFLTYRARASIDRIVGTIVEDTPEYDFVADDGISHTAWVVRDSATVGAITREFSRIESLYIADGHHRAASAAAVARMRRDGNPHHRGDEQYNYTLAVIFPHDQLKVIDYNRAVRDLNGLSAEEFLEQVHEKFFIFDQFQNKKPEYVHEFGMYLQGSWYKLVARDSIRHDDDVIESLDVSILQHNLLSPTLGIHDPRTDERIAFIGGIRGMEELEKLVDSGQYSVAFALYPTTLTQLMRVADAGKMMPPKSTWFEPKLRSGMFVHMLD